MTKSKKLIARKQRRFYSYSITLTREQIDWLREQEDVSDLFRKFVDDLMKSVSLEEVARLEDRAYLLNYKKEALDKRIELMPPDTDVNISKRSATAEANKVTEEIEELRKKAQEIRKNIQRAEEKKKEEQNAWKSQIR